MDILIKTPYLTEPLSLELDDSRDTPKILLEQIAKRFEGLNIQESDLDKWKLIHSNSILIPNETFREQNIKDKDELRLEFYESTLPAYYKKNYLPAIIMNKSGKIDLKLKTLNLYGRLTSYLFGTVFSGLGLIDILSSNIDWNEQTLLAYGLALLGLGASNKIIKNG